jgi:hypothetical protein
MGDKQKLKIENCIKDLEDRLENIGKMVPSDKRSELKRVDGILGGLDSDIQRFQMTEYMRFPEECDNFEHILADLTDKFKKVDFDGDNSAGDGDGFEGNDPTQLQIYETNSKLKEGKNRALAMLHTINNMKEDITLIDDEVMMQREKLLSINDKLKETQSVITQTKRLISYFSKAVYDDLFIKILIGLIVVIIIVILAMAINIKIKRGNLVNDKSEKDKSEAAVDNYDDIDEVMFQNYIVKRKKKPENTEASSPNPKTMEKASRTGEDNPETASENTSKTLGEVSPADGITPKESSQSTGTTPETASKPADITLEAPSQHVKVIPKASQDAGVV